MLGKISAVAILGILLGISQGALWAAHPALVPQEKKEAREQHPHIRAAIQELRDAKRELQTAVTTSVATASRPWQPLITL